MEFQVKVWKQLLLIWKRKTMRIEEDKIILKKTKSKTGDDKSDKIYSLINAVVVDRSKPNDPVILIASSTYKINIKPKSIEEKNTIISKIEEILKKYSSQNAFSEQYKLSNEELLKKTGKNSPFQGLLYNLSVFHNLMLEISQKLDNLKNLIEKKATDTEYMTVHNNLCTIKEEMKKQYDNIIVSIYNYHDLLEGKNDDDMGINLRKENEEDNTNKINEIEEKPMNIENSVCLYDLYKDPTRNNNYYFLSNIASDFYDPNYNYNTRKSLPGQLKFPQNIVKEMMGNITKKQSAPVYFNEPISIGQKQCEKFYYLELLNKAARENKKEMQMCYIASFIIGEIFLSLGRCLKPFTPIIGETYEYINNKKKFRFYSEQISHTPTINAYIGETPDFAYYGDTANSVSFKFFKGGLELVLTNKNNVYLKRTKDHYTFNFPSLCVKGLVKPPLYNDYYGTTIIQNKDDPCYKCEITFTEESSWSNNSLGNFEGTVYGKNDKKVYLLKGNWKKEIYMTDINGDNKKVLLSLDQDTAYLKNNADNYSLPEFTYELNYMNKRLERSLPLNDSRFRKDIRLLEYGNDLDTAQKYKKRYEEKQKKELENDQHKILFFNELVDEETNEKYYVPNGKYWEMKKKNELKNHANANIFDVTNYENI